MARLRPHLVRRRALEEVQNFLRQRCLDRTMSGHFALAADYSLRWLNSNATDLDALALGQRLGDLVGQGELSHKCTEQLEQVVRQRLVADSPNHEQQRTKAKSNSDVDDVAAAEEDDVAALALQYLSPSTVEALAQIQAHLDREGEAEGREVTGDALEELEVVPRQSLMETNERMARLCAGEDVDLEGDDDGSSDGTDKDTLMNHRRRRPTPQVMAECPIEVLHPRDSLFGRGLFAKRRLQPGEVLFAESPALSALMPPPLPSGSSTSSSASSTTASPTRCAQCFEQLSSSSSSSSHKNHPPLPCPTGPCRDVLYCSPQCQQAARDGYHQCCCPATNKAFASWVAPLKTDFYTSTSATSSGHPPSASLRALTPEKQAALTMYAVGQICAAATVQQQHPLALSTMTCLSGRVTYQRSTTLSYTGAVAVQLASALHQEHLYLEDIVKLFALIQDNAFFDLRRGTVELFPSLAMLNHSCVPNAEVAPVASRTTAGSSFAAASARQGRRLKGLTVTRPVRPGEQLSINYNAGLLPSTASYDERQLMLQRRRIECTCPKCVLRQ